MSANTGDLESTVQRAQGPKICVMKIASEWGISDIS